MNKKIKYLLTMLVVVFAMVAVCGCGDDEKDDDAKKNAASEEVNKYAEKSYHSKDIQALDSVNTAIKTYVAEPTATYADERVYTLTEMLENDSANVIKPIIAEAFSIKDDFGTFNAKSKAFKGVTTDDVLVCIDKGMVSIYVESQEEGYSDFTTGYGKDLAN